MSSTESDIFQIIQNDLPDTITKESLESLTKQLDSKYNDAPAVNPHLLMNALKDLLESGKTDKSDYIKEIKEQNLISRVFRIQQRSTAKPINTKLENIIRALKEIRLEATKQKDMGSTLDIDWIIKTLNEENIYEIDPTVVKNEHLNTEDNKNGLDYLIQYSKLEDMNQKNKDFNAVRKVSRPKTFSRFDNEKLLKGEKEEKRRESIDNSSVQGLGLSPEISTKILTLMSRIDYTDFDIFTLDTLTPTKGSVLVGNEILDRLDFVKSGIVDISTLRNFVQTAVDCYSRENAVYHNDLHAADVMQTLYTMLIRGELKRKMKLEGLDCFSMLVGALCHDLRHTGQNNVFHINSKSKIAIRYNDISVLENFHIASTFKLLKDDKVNILKNFKPEEYRITRRRMIDGIIATDMANHQKVLSATKAKIETYQIHSGQNFINVFDVETGKLFDAQQCILNMALHTADISNPAKPGKISDAWTDRVYGEFFIQGDLEKKMGLPVSLLCDRETTNINKAMIGFINFVVMPTIDILVDLIPEVSQYGINIRNNLKKYEANVAAEKEKEEKEKK